MVHWFGGLLLSLVLTGIGWCQTDICEGYQDSPDAPHTGPLRFNVIHLGFVGDDSYVLIIDPQGHRFGVDSSGKAVAREIVRGFYEDDETAAMDTNLPPRRHPREMTIHFAKSGKYRIAMTARTASAQWLKVAANTCGKAWSTEMTIPPARAGTVTQLTLLYDARGKVEPQLASESSLRLSFRAERRP